MQESGSDVVNVSISHPIPEYNQMGNIAQDHGGEYDDGDDEKDGNWMYDPNYKKRSAVGGFDPDDDNANKKNRGNYRCSKCGQLKKGHVCPFQPHFRKRDDENDDGPDAFDVETQVEMDAEMTVRMLALDRQGYPDSYIIDPTAHMMPPGSYMGIGEDGVDVEQEHDVGEDGHDMRNREIPPLRSIYQPKMESGIDASFLNRPLP